MNKCHSREVKQHASVLTVKYTWHMLILLPLLHFFMNYVNPRLELNAEDTN